MTRFNFHVYFGLFKFRKWKSKIILSTCLLTTLLWVASLLQEKLESFRCWQLKQTAVGELCNSFQRKESIGTFCWDLCVSNQLMLMDCPNMDGHDGKDYVFEAKWDKTNVIIKARALKENLLNNRQRFEPNILLESIRDTMKITFGDTSDFTVASLIPWQTRVSVQGLNLTEIQNLWYLCQDNEYVLSKALGDSSTTAEFSIFPKIVGTCGHFYAVEYADSILDFTYFTPSWLMLWSRPFEDKLYLALLLFKFLMSLEDSKSGLELCDVKFEHFGLFNSELKMIDSDMIHREETANQLIAAMSPCKNSEECDFIDCKGVCAASKCLPDSADTNIKRLCRNMFFIGSLEWLPLNFGLLTDPPTKYKSAVDFIKDICLQTSVRNNSKSIVQRLSAMLKSING